MADSMQDSVVQLRKHKNAAAETLTRATRHEASCEKAHRDAAPGDRDAKRELWNAAREATRLAADAVRDAELALENHSDEQQEANADSDPIEPQTNYTLSEIVAKLSHFAQRATYGAIGGYLGWSPDFVRMQFTGKEAPSNSFVVSSQNGRPTNYLPSHIDSRLARHSEVLKTPEDLLSWLQKSRLPRR